MTLYVVSNIKGVREDNFAWYEGNEGKYWFNGATFTKKGWVLNSVWWGKYYIMTSNLGIGIQEGKIVLVENGKKTTTVHVAPNKTKLVRRNEFFHEATVPELIKSDPEQWSTWHEIKGLLKTTYPSQEAKKILSAMNKWEKVSHQTVLRVENTMKGQAGSQDIVEIYVAGYQWLWHNATKGIVTMGYKESVWGSVHLHSGGAIITRGASPIHNGWLVGLDSHNKYLLRWNGYNMEMSAFIFPYGPWADRGKWRLWRLEPSVLTPLNRLVTVPKPYRSFKGDYLDWVCFRSPDSEGNLLLINHQGELLYLDLSKHPGFEKIPAICPGERCVLVDHSIYADGREWQSFSLISLSPTTSAEQPPEPLWQVRVAPVDEARVVLYPFYIKDGTTEVFVFTFDTYDENWGVGLINERGQFWLAPFIVKRAFLDYHVDADGVIKYDRLVVAPSERFSMPGSGLGVIRVSGGQVHVEPESGVTMSDPLIPLPRGKKGLWSHLAAVLHLAFAAKEQYGLSTTGRIMW